MYPHAQQPRYPYPQQQPYPQPQPYPQQPYPQQPYPPQQYMPPQQYPPQHYGQYQGQQQRQESHMGKMACLASLTACCTACLCSCLGGGGSPYSEGGGSDDYDTDVRYVTEIIRLPPRSSSAPVLSDLLKNEIEERKRRKIENLSPNLVKKCNQVIAKR